mgnify:CR=1 FL=1
MGGGVLLKYNARQTYTTSGFTGAAFTAICKKAVCRCRCLQTAPMCRAAPRWAICWAIRS